MQAPHIICSLCQFNIPPNMLLRIICVNWPCTHIHINKCGYRILYAVIAYRMREPHTVCGRRIPYAGSRIPYAGSRIPYVNPPITQITNYMWLPHTGCGNRIQDAENRILYAVTPYLVDSHPICGARIQYAGTAYSMRDRIQYAGTAYSMRAWDQGKFTGVALAVPACSFSLIFLPARSRAVIGCGILYLWEVCQLRWFRPNACFMWSSTAPVTSASVFSSR